MAAVIAGMPGPVVSSVSTGSRACAKIAAIDAVHGAVISMGSTLPEPGPGAEQGVGSALPQAAVPTSPRPTRRLSNARIICGVVWAFIAIVIGVGGVAEAAIGNVGGAILCFVIAPLAGWYDVRVWTLKARRLFLVIDIVRERPR